MATETEGKGTPEETKGDSLANRAKGKTDEDKADDELVKSLGDKADSIAAMVDRAARKYLEIREAEAANKLEAEKIRATSRNLRSANGMNERVQMATLAQQERMHVATLDGADRRNARKIVAIVVAVAVAGLVVIALHDKALASTIVQAVAVFGSGIGVDRLWLSRGSRSRVRMRALNASGGAEGEAPKARDKDDQT